MGARERKPNPEHAKQHAAWQDAHYKAVAWLQREIRDFINSSDPAATADGVLEALQAVRASKLMEPF